MTKTYAEQQKEVNEAAVAALKKCRAGKAVKP